MVFQWFQIDGKKINNARYADDTTIIASTDEFVRKYFEDSVNESDPLTGRSIPRRQRLWLSAEEDRCISD